MWCWRVNTLRPEPSHARHSSAFSLFSKRSFSFHLFVLDQCQQPRASCHLPPLCYWMNCVGEQSRPGLAPPHQHCFDRPTTFSGLLVPIHCGPASAQTWFWISFLSIVLPLDGCFAHWDWLMDFSGESSGFSHTPESTLYVIDPADVKTLPGGDMTAFLICYERFIFGLNLQK